MDIFNKKKIEFLEAELKRVVNEIYEWKDKTKQPKCFSCGDSLPEFSILAYIGNHLRAIENYLKIRITWDWEDDPNLPPPEPKQKKVWRAKKIKEK